MKKKKKTQHEYRRANTEVSTVNSGLTLVSSYMTHVKNIYIKSNPG